MDDDQSRITVMANLVSDQALKKKVALEKWNMKGKKPLYEITLKNIAAKFWILSELFSFYYNFVRFNLMSTNMTDILTFKLTRQI